MWTIPKPNLTALDTFNICIGGIRNATKKQRFEGIRVLIEQAEQTFDLRAANIELHHIAEAINLAGRNGNVSATEMEQLYDSHMARQKSRGRDTYDTIMMAAKHGQCPFCGHLPVSTLDHSLPKARHPALAVTPFNLIPCCKDCNHNKGSLRPNSHETQFFHAYYDDITQDRWLYAEIVEGATPGAIFFVEAPEHWGAVTVERVRRQFSNLELGKLYASQAGRQLQNIKRSLSNIYDAAGSDAVRGDLEDRSESCAAVSINSWEGSLYEAASQSDWYCDGGFDK